MVEAARHLLSDEAVKLTTAEIAAALPEIYQPLFNHPELSIRVSRTCEDRLESTIRVYNLLAGQLNRPLRVLDLGCAQGFFSLNLANLGATVTGIDCLPANIDMCSRLAEENPSFKAAFRVDLIENIVAHLEPGHYDLVLGLSVFHHLVPAWGLAVVQAMFTKLGENITAGIYEMALRSEPPNWSHFQPENPRDLLAGYSFVHKLGDNGTHLSDVKRPLYVASNSYWFLGDQIGAFDSWTTESHALVHNASLGMRRYFFGKDTLAKLFIYDETGRGQMSVREHANEVAFLSSPPDNFKTPRLHLHGQNECEVWLVRDKIQGELLLTKITERKAYDANRVIREILAKLVVLEAVNLYCGDLRTWNVLIEPGGHPMLIDYGAISDRQGDCAWPYNLHLSFMIFVREVVTFSVFSPVPSRPACFQPEFFPEPYQSRFRKLYETPPETWNFALIHQVFSSIH